MKQYPVANDQAYLYYRLDITRNHGANIVQLAEWQISNGEHRAAAGPVMRSRVGKAPSSAYNAKTNVGFTGVRALQYARRAHQPTAAATPTTRSSTST